MNWPDATEPWILRHAWCVMACIVLFALGFMAGTLTG